MSDNERLSEVALKIADLAIALGAAPLNRLDGAWVHQVNEHWHVAANAHKTPVEVEPTGCMAVTLEPFHMAVWWHGWLAGLVNPYGGTIAAHPTGANEDRLISDLEAAIVGAQQ